MGSIVKPICKCDSEFNEIFLGTGMRIFGRNHRDIVPSPCSKCKSVVETNLFNKRYRCPKCRKKVEPYVKYTKKELIGFETPMEYDHEYDYELEDKKYKCPNCNEVELRFENWGCWD